MTHPSTASGYFRCGLPYNRAGSGPRLLAGPGCPPDTRCTTWAMITRR